MVPSQGVFVDVGAAIGYYVILAKRISPQLEIHAFEPFGLFRKYLRENLTLNQIDRDEVVLHSTALSSRPGTALFRKAGFGSSLVDEASGTLGKLAHGLARILRVQGAAPSAPRSGAMGPMRQTRVSTTTVDALAASRPGPIDLAKIDVQGWELEVLRGAAQAIERGLVRTWLVGTHSRRLHADCLRFLSRRGCEVLFEEVELSHQPDGIIVARAG